MATVSGQLSGGVSSVRLSGKLKAGTLEIDAQEFVVGDDRTLIARGRLKSNELYRAFFSHDNERSVYAVISDNGIKTRIEMHDDSDDDTTGVVSIWNDGAEPQSFRVDVRKFLKTRDPLLSILTSSGAPLDFVGLRKPPAVTPAEVVSTFAKAPAFKEFMRGIEHHELARKKKGGVNWKCAWICLVPACGLACLFWKPNRSSTPPAKKVA